MSVIETPTTGLLHPDAEAILDETTADSARMRELDAERQAIARERRAKWYAATQTYRALTYDIIAARCGLSKGLVQKEILRARDEARGEVGAAEAPAE